MAKTYVEYEASDIDTTNDPLHRALFTSVLGAMLIATVKPKEGEDKMGPMNKAIAFVLTTLEKDGFVITFREGSVPKTFLDGFTGPSA